LLHSLDEIIRLRINLPRRFEQLDEWVETIRAAIFFLAIGKPSKPAEVPPVSRAPVRNLSMTLRHLPA
jgi:hypothetical protein